jgi:DNA-binding beta-propeller fold protein YncE
MIFKHITTALALAAGVFVLATADSAFAVGQITNGGCVSPDGSGGLCGATGSLALDGADGVAVSPDGESVYATGLTGQGVSVFKRAAAGQLSYEGCVSDNGSGGKCTDLPGAPLDEVSPVTVSPDGKTVYVGGHGTITVLDRASGGQITYAGCVSNSGSGGLCADVPGAPLTLPNDLAISPDGASLYVAAGGANTLAVFGRAPGGQIAYAGCVSENGSGGLCAPTPAKALDGPTSIAISRDGNSVYVSSQERSAVTVFDRAPEGQLAWAGCVSDSGSDGFCADVPGKPLDFAKSLTLSADQKSLYVAALNSGAVSLFDRAATGQIVFAGCVSSDGSGGLCADAPGAKLLKGANEIGTSADGASVYAVGLDSGAVNVLDRAPGGQIVWAGCVSGDGSGGLCADIPGPFVIPGRIALSPDDGSLYVSAPSSDTVTHLFRKKFPSTSIASGPDEGSASADPRPSFTFSSDQAGASFECSLDGASFAACPSPATFGPLRDGTHRVAVRAVTGGAADPTPESRSFSVDTTGPSVKITKAPKRKVKTTKRKVRVTFAFSSPEPGVSFRCRLDRRATGPCNASIGYLIGRGKHTFTVSAADKLGNRGPAATAAVEVVKKKAKKRKGRR